MEERRYRLTAELAGSTVVEPIIVRLDDRLLRLAPGDPQAAADFDATLQSVCHVMAQAQRRPVWARGRVRLLDGDRLVHEMEPK